MEQGNQQVRLLAVVVYMTLLWLLGCGSGGVVNPPGTATTRSCRNLAPVLASGLASRAALASEDQFLIELPPPQHFRAEMAPIDVDGDCRPEMVVAQTAHERQPMGQQAQDMSLAEVRDESGGDEEQTDGTSAGWPVPVGVAEVPR